jgi:hypothetical protein
MAGGPPYALANEVKIAAPVGVSRSPSAAIPDSGAPRSK